MEIYYDRLFYRTMSNTRRETYANCHQRELVSSSLKVT